MLVLEYMLPLGCLVHMTPVFEAMKRSRPEIELTVATRGLGLQVLRHSPFIDRLIETPDPTTDFGAAVRTLRKELRARTNCVQIASSPEHQTSGPEFALPECSGRRDGGEASR